MNTRKVFVAVLVVVALCALAGSHTLANDVPVRVKKNAQTWLTRKYDWTIEKWAAETTLNLALGQEVEVAYRVEVAPTALESAGVSGDIWVTVFAPGDVTITNVSDVVSPNIPATVECLWLPYHIPPLEGEASWTLPCTYSAELPDTSNRTNTATATIEGIEYTGTADVIFDDKTTLNEIDECIDVSDTYAGYLGTVCARDEVKTFTYSRPVGPFDECGAYIVENTASFVTNDTGAEGSASWTIEVDVPCEESPGTGTPGYWKTHADAWPVESITIGGLTYAKDEAIEQMDMPEEGDKSYTMFRALVAAKLNVLIGNDDSCIADTIANADAWMAAYGPVGSGVRAGGKDSPWREGERLYELLDAYNNGQLCAPARE